MVEVITGENDFARLSYIDSLIKDFVKTNGEFALEKFDASQVEFSKLIEAVSTIPFLAKERMVIVHDLSANKLALDNIEQLIDSVSDENHLIIIERKFDKRLSLYKTLKKRTKIHEFGQLDERSLAKWLVEEAKLRGGLLKTNDADIIVRLVGTNQQLASNDLDKLIAYNSEITSETIELLVEPMPQELVFDLIDAAFNGDKAKALKLYARQRKQQVEPQAIMGLIIWQLNTLAVVKFNASEGESFIAREFGMKPYTVSKNMKLATRLSAAQVKDMLAKTLRLDVRLKSESIDADDAVQNFLLSI